VLSPRFDAALRTRAQRLLAMPTESAYVPSVSSPTPLTAEQLLRVSIPGKRVELVRGLLLVREPAGLRQGRVVATLSRRLSEHVEANGSGQVYVGDTGFTLARDPDTVRAPDIAFIRRERIPDPEPPGYPDLAPDLAVEVLSSSNRPGEVLAKVADWLSGGTTLVWVIDPERSLARVYRQDGTEAVVRGSESLSGEDLLPGFACTLGALS
jgi:Uma2 family endonuclease